MDIREFVELLGSDLEGWPEVRKVEIEECDDSMVVKIVNKRFLIEVKEV